LLQRTRRETGQAMLALGRGKVKNAKMMGW